MLINGLLILFGVVGLGAIIIAYLINGEDDDSDYLG